MRYLILLLSCIAAANAGYWGYSAGCYTPCYRYVCVSKPVLDAVPCLKSSPTCKSSWFQCYSDLDVTYPADGTCDAGSAESDVADLVLTYNGKLATKKASIVGELDTAKATFDAKVVSDTAAYKATQNGKIDAWKAAELAKEGADADVINAKAEKYKSQMETCADNNAKCAKDHYQCQYDSIVNRLTCHVERLEKCYESCLTTRVAKIGAYNGQVDTKIDNMKTCFDDNLASMKTKMSNNFKASLEKICADGDYAAIIALYELKIDGQISVKQGDFDTKADANAVTLKTNFKCNYRCGACGRNLKCTRTCLDWSCKGLTVPCARTKKFTFNYRTPCLDPCTCDEQVQKTDEEICAEIKPKIDAAKAEANSKKSTWMTAQEAANAAAITKYKAAVEAKHVKEIEQLTACLGDDPDAATKIAAREAKQAEELTKLVGDFTDKVDAQYECAKERFDAVIEKYVKRLESRRDCIKTSYASCWTRRTECLTAYETKVDEMIEARRQCLATRLGEVLTKNVECANEFVVTFVGEDNREHEAVTGLINAYSTKLQGEHNVIKQEFETYWTDMGPKLKTAAGCKITCTLPEFKAGTFCYTQCVYEPKCVVYTYTKCYTPCYGKYYGGYCC